LECDVAAVNINILGYVDTVNTYRLALDMAVSASTRPARKRPGHYHHGDLRRALLQEAVRVIQEQGVDVLTVRSVGERLGVSRTALYRHFADKSALLAAVAREGFRTLRLELLAAWGDGGWPQFEAMGLAYVRFAVANPSHYRVMFGGLVKGHTDPGLEQEAAGAFQALVDAIAALQRSAELRNDDPLQLAQFIWALVHGIAMLAIDGQLEHQGATVESVARLALERLRTGVGVDGETSSNVCVQRIGGNAEQLPSSYPPASAPTMRNGSRPFATASGSGVSGASCDTSSSQAKKRTKGRRRIVT
jgi:AcrR family transcriptional regulator